MGRPKKKVEEVQGTESTKEVKVETKVTKAEVKPVQVEEKPLKDKDLYLVKVGGVDRYMTKAQVRVSMQRRDLDIVIPKGSPLVVNVPQEDCKDCG